MASVSMSSSMAVHPHSRGEHTVCFISSHDFLGSSPLARGTRRFLGAKTPQVRFIPTRAGNTVLAPSSCACVAVHPHSRGEHALRSCGLIRPAGSSPLARGTHQCGASHQARHRFIPTRARNTISGDALEPCNSVHPHSRGEH